MNKLSTQPQAKLPAALSYNKSQPIICSVTGLTIFLDVPAIPGKYLSYDNPLSSIKVANQYGKASHAELSLLAPEILAALILTTFRGLNLLESKLEAIELNASLCILSKHSLVESFKLLNLLLNNPSKCAYPSICLNSIIEIPTTFTEYIKTLRQLLNGTYWDANKEATVSLDDDATPVYKINKPKKLTTKQLDTFKGTLKTHLKVLQKELVDKPKLLTLLSLLTKNEALRTVSVDVRTKVIAVLRLQTESKAAQSFANILERSAEGSTELYLGESAIATPVAKKTLAQILAEKTGKHLPKAEAEDLWNSEIQVTEAEVELSTETPEDFSEVEASEAEAKKDCFADEDFAEEEGEDYNDF